MPLHDANGIDNTIKLSLLINATICAYTSIQMNSLWVNYNVEHFSLKRYFSTRKWILTSDVSEIAIRKLCSAVSRHQATIAESLRYKSGSVGYFRQISAQDEFYDFIP